MTPPLLLLLGALLIPSVFAAPAQAPADPTPPRARELAAVPPPPAAIANRRIAAAPPAPALPAPAPKKARPARPEYLFL